MNNILIFAGAGISAESGLNTFRDEGGLWQLYDVDEVCNYRVFKDAKNDTAKRQHIFDFYNLVKTSILEAQPNDAHKMVAHWQKKYGAQRVRVVTANIDNLFERAGCIDVVHVHGDINYMHCTACGHKWHIGNKAYNHEPRCQSCESRLTKPHVVFFGEQAPEYMRMNQIFNLHKRNSEDIVMVIGSSMSVIQAQRIVQHKNYKTTGHTVLVNKDPGDDDHWFKHVFYGPATEKLKIINETMIEKIMMK